MINDMNAFELSDEQLEEVTGGSLVDINTVIAPQFNITTQTTNVIAPTTGVVVGLGGNTGLQLLGSQIKAGNGSLLGNSFKLK
jgi:hypothetical protein